MKKYLLVLGWVIWLNSGASWQRLGSNNFESESDCNVEKTTRMEVMVANRKDGSIVSEGTIKFRGMSGEFQLLNFSCLEDDDDPRY